MSNYTDRDNKLQWQNASDSKAHIMFGGKDESGKINFTCRKDADRTEPVPPANQQNLDKPATTTASAPSNDSAQILQTLEIQFKRLQIVENFVNVKLPGAVDAKKGMYVKILWDAVK